MGAGGGEKLAMRVGGIGLQGDSVVAVAEGGRMRALPPSVANTVSAAALGGDGKHEAGEGFWAEEVYVWGRIWCPHRIVV